MKPKIPDLKGRLKLAYEWIPKDAKICLDAGCSQGYGTYHFNKKVIECYGIDPDKESIEIAKKRYNNIYFKQGNLEKTNYPNEFFDVIIMTDVLEHVEDEIKSLNEIYRILKKGRYLIITVPHKGLFSFMDPANYIYNIRTKIPSLYNLLYKLKNGKKPPKIKKGWDHKHRHYSYKNITALLNNTKFKDNYHIEKIHKSSLLIGVFTLNIDFILTPFFSKKIREKILRPLDYLSNMDYFINYGPLSYDLGIKLIKNK